MVSHFYLILFLASPWYNEDEEALPPVAYSHIITRFNGEDTR